MRGSDPLLDSIARACNGLVVTSETDAPVVAVEFRVPLGSLLTAQDVLRLVGRDVETRIEEQSLREFFEPLGRRRDWHDGRDAEMARRFRRLERILQRRLTDARVFRIGDRSIDVCLLGRARDGRIVGVQTSVVET